jgi:hypothetical protein
LISTPFLPVFGQCPNAGKPAALKKQKEPSVERASDAGQQIEHAKALVIACR